MRFPPSTPAWADPGGAPAADERVPHESRSAQYVTEYAMAYGQYGRAGQGQHQPLREVQAERRHVPTGTMNVVTTDTSDDDQKRRQRHCGNIAGEARGTSDTAPSSSAAAADDGPNSGDEMDPPTSAGRASQRDFPDDATFVDAIKRRGWEVHHMREDGACLFRAVAFHLFGDQDMHGTVRDQCMDYMVRNRSHFEEFITEDFDAYIARKRGDHCFGNHLEMQAMSELYNRNFEVYEYSIEPTNIFQVSSNTNEPIRVSYHGSIHYNAIFDPARPSFGVGLGFAGLQPGAADKMQMDKAQALSEQSLLDEQLLADSLAMSEEELLQQQIEQQVLLESQREYYQNMQGQH